MNLAHYVRSYTTGPDIDEAQLIEDTTAAVRFLDNVLTMEASPLPEIDAAIKDKRRIGLGVMGLADMLILLGLPYDSEAGRLKVREVIGLIRDAALKASEELGRERGVPTGVKRAGLNRRNIAILTVAPTGTTSMLAGVSSGVEPVFAATYARRIGTEYHKLVHPLLERMLDEHKAWTHTPRAQLVELIDSQHGSVLPLVVGGLLPEAFAAFQTAHDVSPEAHVRMQAAVQHSFDYRDGETPTYAGNSISKTCNLPNDASVADVFMAYALAFETGCKGVTVYRDGSRDLQVLTTGTADADKAQPTASSALTTEEDSKEEPQAPVTTGPTGEQVDVSPSAAAPYPVRPPVVHGSTSKWEAAGKKMYVTVNQNDDGEVVEVFINLSRPTPEEAVAAGVVGRLISLALKHGASPYDVATTLEGHMDTTGGMVRGFGYAGSKWDLVAHSIRQEASLQHITVNVIKHDDAWLEQMVAEHDALHVGEENARSDIRALVTENIEFLHKMAALDKPKDACPECGERMRKAEGCWKCETCGFSKCG